MSDRDTLLLILAKATGFEWIECDDVLIIRQDVVNDENHEEIGLSASLHLRFDNDGRLRDVSVVLDGYDPTKWHEIEENK